MMRHDERGQALLETAIFLPVALTVLFAIIYFSRFGVLAGRAESAARYGALIAYNSTPAYSAADIYTAIATGGTALAPCPANVVPDTIAAVSGQYGAGGATPSPYWRPDAAATTACTHTVIGYGGPAWAALQRVTNTRQAVAAGVVAPPFLCGVVGGGINNASASLGYVRSDPPSVIMYCVGGAEVAAALGFTYAGGGPC